MAAPLSATLRSRKDDPRHVIVRWLGMQLTLLCAAARSLTRRPLPATPSGTHSYARRSPHRWLPWFLLLSLPADALFVALVLPPGSDLIAWLLFVVTVYSLLWSIGVYRTMHEHPHATAPDHVAFHNGALATLTFEPATITSVRVHPGFAPGAANARRYMRDAGLFIYGLGPFVDIRLGTPAILTTALRDRVVTRVLVQADEPEALATALQRSRGEPVDAAR